MKVIRPAVVGVLVVLAAACNGETSEPSTLPDLTPTVADTSPTPAPTPTVDPPVEPPNAHDYSEEGVEAFTRYAIDVINYAYQTNDVTYLEQIMTSDCQTCANTVRNLESMAADGSRVDGGEVTIHEVVPQAPAENVSPGAVVDATIHPSTTYDGAGQITDSADEEPLQLVFLLAREGSRWKIQSIGHASEGS